MGTYLKQMCPLSFSGKVREVFQEAFGQGKPGDGWVCEETLGSSFCFTKRYSAELADKRHAPFVTRVELAILKIRHQKGILIELDVNESGCLHFTIKGDLESMKECCALTSHINRLILVAEQQEKE